jgi:Outer membrane protein beta-barrel domain
MKTTLITATVAGFLLAGSTAQAQVWSDTVDWFSDHFTASQTTGDLFNPEEVSLDLGLNWYSKNRGTDGRFGFGFGGNYFFTRELGIGLDSNIGFNGHSFFDYFHASAIYRYPIEEWHLAPYAIAGVGCEFDPGTELSGHFGGGVEYRFNPLTGVYVDATWNVVHRVSNYVLLRGGIRVLF